MILNHFDIATAYLNKKLKEKVFMEIPKYSTDALFNIILSDSINIDVRREAQRMLEQILKGEKICLLNKALYGLRQAGRCWNNRINEELLRFGAKKSTADPYVYHRGSGADQILIAIYVDDIAASRSVNIIEDFGKFLSNAFKITDLGPIKYCLGIKFTQQEDEITMPERIYY